MDLVILIGLGGLLLAAEIFIPGGIAGLIGIACLIGAVIVGFLDYGPEIGALILACVFLFLIIGIGLWAKYFHLTPIAKALTDKGVIGGASIDDRTEELLGAQGEAISALRPCGMAKINDTRVDVVAESGMIDQGEIVKVVAVEGFRVVVQRLESKSNKETTAVQESTS